MAFTVYETIKQLVEANVEQDKLLLTVEKYVNHYYNEAVIELYKKKLIDKITKEKALTEYNVDNFLNDESFQSSSFIGRILSICFALYVCIILSVRDFSVLWLTCVVLSIAASVYLLYRNGAISSKPLLVYVCFVMILVEILRLLISDNNVMLILLVLLVGNVVGIYISERVMNLSSKS